MNNENICLQPRFPRWKRMLAWFKKNGVA